MWTPSWLTACVAIGNFSSIFYCTPMLRLPGLTSSVGNSNSPPSANPKQSHSGRKKFGELLTRLLSNIKYAGQNKYTWFTVCAAYVYMQIYIFMYVYLLRTTLSLSWSWCQIPAMHHRLHNAVCVHSHVKAGESAEISDKFLPVRRWFTGQLDASAGEFVHERMCRHVKCVKVPVVIFHLSD